MLNLTPIIDAIKGMTAAMNNLASAVREATVEVKRTREASLPITVPAIFGPASGYNPDSLTLTTIPPYNGGPGSFTTCNGRCGCTTCDCDCAAK